MTDELRKYKTIITFIKGEVHTIFSDKYPEMMVVRIDGEEIEEYEIPVDYKHIVGEGDTVEAGQILAYREIGDAWNYNRVEAENKRHSLINRLIDLDAEEPPNSWTMPLDELEAIVNKIERNQKAGD